MLMTDIVVYAALSLIILLEIRFKVCMYCCQMGDMFYFTEKFENGSMQISRVRSSVSYAKRFPRNRKTLEEYLFLTFCC